MVSIVQQLLDVATGLLFLLIMPIDWPNSLPVPLMMRTHGINSRSTTTIMETGRPRVRPEYDQPFETANYVWHFTEDQFSVFKDFLEINLANGVNNFYLSGYEGGLLVYHVVAFMGGYNVEHSDNLYAVSAQVEIVEDES